jgi:hypothetical protein
MEGAWPAFLFRPGASPAARPPFARPAEALLWLDWRRTGWIMPLFVNICLIPELLLIYFIEPQHPIMASVAAAVFLATLVMESLVMAFAVGTALGNMHPWAPGKYAMPPFCAARPVTSSELLIVKARLAVRIVAVSGLVVLLPIVAILPFTFAGRVLGGWARELIELYGLRGAGLLLTGAAALAFLHVKAIVDHMFIGLAGRAWVPIAVGVAIMVCSVMVGMLIGWIAANPDVQDVLLNAVPWAVALALALKVMAGALVGRILVRRELVTHRSLALFAAAWLVAAVWLVGLVVFVMPPELYSPWVVGCSAVVLLLPMVRLGLAPLALEWNRHR